MGGINENISNGTCWSNANVALGVYYIPCGNTADGNSYACCHLGDNCLSSHACYHAKFGITYIAGCTTQDFSGPGCQNKGNFFNQSWVGLVRCDPVQTSWAGCPGPNDVVGSSPPPGNCKCSDDNILFEDNPSLDNIASLPAELGGSISWFPGHAPTASAPTSTRTTQSSQPTPSTSISSTGGPTVSDLPTETPTAAPSSQNGLSTGEKTGVGVGSAFGALIVIALVAIAVILRKRKAKKNDFPNMQPSIPTTGTDTVQHQNPIPDSSAFGGFKAELPANEPGRVNSQAAPSMVSSMTFPSPSHSPNPQQYQPYRPGVYGNDRHSNVSQLSSGIRGGHESLVSAPSPRPPEEPHNSTTLENPRPGQLNKIFELP
ncbi:hypothetical protein F4777DRAFT_577251 [Nemania sp. FL0916]|nr:hypothetical protein F4777DRAFT_577251 [Nemania sp. FL0916]